MEKFIELGFLEWVFDGIGTEIVSIVISLFIGGIIGYRVGVKKTIKQKQQAGDKANQKQKVASDISSIESTKKKSNFETTVVQTQIAGDNSSQLQIGDIRNDEE